ncbi:MAG: Gfo/Idh/MocA family protein [Pseudorhodoplanes sp.]|uniref:Gfo/Idh/MocA family protein n=1 Tax=Pseudorhodoplanes sp. TaxID=1934341 RepID=UPI003D1449FB
MTTSRKKVRLGVIGLGKAYSFLSRALREDERIELVAAADPNESARLTFHSKTGGVAYADAGQLLADSRIDAVYIATPPATHLSLTLAAAAAGKHILIEKPMSVSITECETMVQAADKAHVQLLVGHTHSYDLPILMARAHILSGKYGRLRHLTLVNYNNFLTRLRAPDALDSKNGGGVVLHQGFHQVDVARLIAGGLVDTVTASRGFWNNRFHSEGAYTATLRFRCGATATLIYSGYGRFDSDEFCGGVSETGLLKATPPAHESEFGLVERRQRYHEHFGLVLASCEDADIRPGPEGVIIYREHEKTFARAPEVSIPRSEVIDELYGAVVNGESPLHSGNWALATQEVCELMLSKSSESGSHKLKLQVEHAPISERRFDKSVVPAAIHNRQQV